MVSADRAVLDFAEVELMIDVVPARFVARPDRRADARPHILRRSQHRS